MKNNKIWLLLGLYLYAYQYVYEYFYYQGFGLDFSILKLLIFVLLNFMYLKLCRAIKKKEYEFILDSTYLIIIIPIGVYFVYNNDSTLLFVSSILYIYLQLIVFLKLKVASLKIKRVRNIYAYTILFLILTLPLFINYIKYFNFTTFIISNVYDIRTQFRELDNASNLSGYLFSPITRIILPVLIVMSMDYRRIFFAVIFIVISLVFYTFGALKVTLLSLLMTFIFYHGDIIKKVNRLHNLFIAINLAAILEVVIFKSYIIIDVFIRRVFYIPALYSNIYIEYFKNDLTFWSHNPIGAIFNKTRFSSENISFYVGNNVIGDTGLNANVGLLAEGFFSFSFFGVALHAIIIAYMFKYCTNLIHHKYYGIVFVMIYVTNTSFYTQLLATHGLIFLLLYFSLNQKK